MKKLLLLALAMASVAARGNVQVDIYTSFDNSHPSGLPYSGYVGTFWAPDIAFATNTGYDWHPYGLGAFAAKISGGLMVDTDGWYTWGLDSDDGSRLYIGGVLNVDNGNPHAPAFASGNPTYMSAGVCYAFRVEFYEDFGGESGVDLYVDNGNGFALASPDNFCPVPEPASLSAVGIGLAILLRRRGARR